MKRNATSLFFALIAVIGLLTSSAFADLGLQALAAGSQGAPAVGQAVLTAARAVYANNTDPAVIQQQLIAILNEAAATGNESAIRYAIVAVMMAGGTENLAASKAAINNSNAFASYESLTAVTVAAVEMLMTGGGDGAASGGADMGGSGGDSLGGGNKELGGGSYPIDTPTTQIVIDPDNPFTWGSLTGGEVISSPATPI
ncbi:MAG: hypothetical protein HOO88_08960 [Kiritimatiellaceae bacterium]|nr:hypothetical protein [Kiritimatiellaceae bacterium]